MAQLPVSAPGPGPGPRRLATLADLDALPSTHTGHLLRGTLHAFPRPRYPHARAQTRLVARLGPFDPDASGPGGPGGWLLLVEPELRFGGDVVAPDLAGWRREGLDQALLDPYPTVRPDWVCEVLSPSTETFDRGDKAGWYAAAGVDWLWFIDPQEQLLEAYQRDDRVWRPAGAWRGGADVAAPPFAAMNWPLASLWG